MDFGEMNLDNPMTDFSSMPQVLGHEVVCRGRRARTGGGRRRRRRPRGAQPVAVVRPARRRRRSARRARRATSACAGTSPRRRSHPASTSARRGTPPAATRRSCRRTPTMLFAVPDVHATTSIAVFADPFAVSLHSITRHPPHAGRQGARVRRRRPRLVRGRHPARALPRRRGRRGRPLRQPGRARRASSAPTAVLPARAREGADRGGGRVVGRRARPTMEGSTGSRWPTRAASTWSTTPSPRRRRSRPRCAS